MLAVHPNSDISYGQLTIAGITLRWAPPGVKSGRGGIACEASHRCPDARKAGSQDVARVSGRVTGGEDRVSGFAP